MSARDDSLEPPRNRVVSGGLRGRALAVAMALVVVGALGTGWLADNLTVAPQTSTQGAMTRQIGFTKVSLTASPSPLRANQAGTLLLRVLDASGQAVVGARVRCTLSMPAMGMRFASVAAKQTQDSGVYVCATPPLMRGVWSLDVTLTTPIGETGHAIFRLAAA